MSGSVFLCLPGPVSSPFLVKFSDSDLLCVVLGVHHVVVDRHLLPKVPEGPVGDLDCVSVEQGMEDVTWRNGGVEDLEEPGPDTAGYPGIPRWVKPPDLSLPASGFSWMWMSFFSLHQPAEHKILRLVMVIGDLIADIRRWGLNGAFDILCIHLSSNKA